MTAMDEFLSRLASPNFRAVYNGLDEIWNGRARELNEMLAAADLPVRVDNLSSIWTVSYTAPSRYNWMLQYYLRAEGIALSWVGTGRLIFSLNYNDADFAEVAKRFVAAAAKMKADGWWWHRRPHQQGDPPPDPERDAGEQVRAVSSSLRAWTRIAGRSVSSARQWMAARLAYDEAPETWIASAQAPGMTTPRDDDCASDQASFSCSSLCSMMSRPGSISSPRSSASGALL